MTAAAPVLANERTQRAHASPTCESLAGSLAGLAAAVSDASPVRASSTTCAVLCAADTPAPAGVERRIAERLTERLGARAIDLTGLAESDALSHLRMAEALLLVAATDPTSLQLARERADWLRKNDLEECCGLVLWHVPGGGTAEFAEDFTGLPVCALLRREEHVESFAQWVAAEHERTSAAA